VSIASANETGITTGTAAVDARGYAPETGRIPPQNLSIGASMRPTTKTGVTAASGQFSGIRDWRERLRDYVGAFVRRARSAGRRRSGVLRRRFITTTTG
jgi:hypothetical protein